jgi:sensor histidine kinase regulating citrate/malate metabolism
MNILDGMLDSDNVDQARSYIKQVCSDIETVSRKRFCENETANLIFSSFTAKADRLGIKLCVSAKVPQSIPLTDTEICSLLSNGLENAVNTLSEEDGLSKKIELYCDVVGEKLLIEIKNPCTKEVEMSNGIPVSSREGHGYGCQSIYSIVEKHGGLCKFTQNDGVFSLRVILPM